MNSDLLDELWQRQPVPPAQHYREAWERSWEIRRKVDALDGVRPSTAFVGVVTLIVFVCGFGDTFSSWVRYGICLPLALVGAVFAIGPVHFWAQRRKQLRRAGDCLLDELERDLLRLRQNRLFLEWVHWVFPFVFCGAGVWLFWPQSHIYRPLVTSDWIWSGALMLGWAGLAVCFWWCAKTRRRDIAERLSELAALHESLKQLGIPGSSGPS